METVKNNDLKAQFMEEDPNTLAIRRRNNSIIFIFLCIFISLALMLASSFFYHLHSISQSHPPQLSPAVRAYYSVASNAPSRLDQLMKILSVKSDADPDLIFDLSLRSAAEDLDMALDSYILPYTDTEPLFKNCASSLVRDGSGGIRKAVAALRVSPSVERQSEEERSEMVKWIAAAEGKLDLCLVDLWKGRSRGVIDARERVMPVKAYLRWCGREFLGRHDVGMRRFTGGGDWRRNEVLKDVVILCLSGFYFLFLLCILRGICRFVGVKVPPLGNVVRALFTGAIWRR